MKYFRIFYRSASRDTCLQTVRTFRCLPNKTVILIFVEKKTVLKPGPWRQRFFYSYIILMRFRYDEINIITIIYSGGKPLLKSYYFFMRRGDVGQRTTTVKISEIVTLNYPPTKYLCILLYYICIKSIKNRHYYSPPMYSV